MTDPAVSAAALLAGWREAEKAATEGPWSTQKAVIAGIGGAYVIEHGEAEIALVDCAGDLRGEQELADAEFAVTARTAMPRLLDVAKVALSHHPRSANPAYGCGSGDTHGKHYCAGACHVSIDHGTIWEPWPCFPYLEILAALTGTTVLDLTARALAGHKAACLDCQVDTGHRLMSSACPEGLGLTRRWRRAVREAGKDSSDGN
jgi:hypothetical protein